MKENEKVDLPNEVVEIYIVQSEKDLSFKKSFVHRTTLCDVMEAITGEKWVKATLDYHFNKKKVGPEGVSYRGYNISVCEHYKGTPRGRNSGSALNLK